MRIAMIGRGGAGGRAAPAVATDGGGFLDLQEAGLPWSDVEGLIEAGEEGLAEVRKAVEKSSRAKGTDAGVGRSRGAGAAGVPGNFSAPGSETPAGPRLKNPLSRPEKILCIGKNYADHCREFGSPLPERPVLFAKYRNAISGPGDEVALPEGSIDYEAELAAVIGRRCRGVSPADALSFVFGYTCANDLTMRDAQREDGQWTRAKSPDGFCPLGPWIVTADEIPDPQDLRVRLLLNGETMQDSTTSLMVFGVAHLVSFLSRTMTLAPGDVILTGTPAGVGMGRMPPVFLRSGDTVTVEIERIGSLETRLR